MNKKLDPAVSEVLKTHGFGPEACWNCHGTWVVYHRVLEQIAVKSKIDFDPPQVLEANGQNGCVALCVTGRLGGSVQWSVGEAAPGNNKNAYPYAMAEKRAKDRVILKLIGLHGLVYSEDEAPSFKHQWKGPLKVTELKAKINDFSKALKECQTVDSVNELVNAYRGPLDQCEADLSTWYFGDGEDMRGAQQAISDKIEELHAREP